MQMCSVDGCDGPTKARGLCVSHYGKAHNRRDFEPRRLTPRHASPEESLRFVGWDESPEGCWVWRGTRDRHGYGVMKKFQGTEHGSLTHRIAYWAFVGPIPKALSLHHKCANRACLNPDHLEPVTSAQNMGEMLQRAYYEKQIASLQAKLDSLTES